MGAAVFPGGFDLKAFHAAVLEHGALRLTELKNVVREWIASARQATPASTP